MLQLIKSTIESYSFSPQTPRYDKDHEYLNFIDTKDCKIAYMFYKVDDSKTVLLYSHGNRSDIGQKHEFLLKLSKDLNINIISYDYEGYGLTNSVSDEKVPSEHGCIKTINAVYNYLIMNCYKPEDIILYGKSIGTGPTIDLASRIAATNKLNKLKGVILQSPYTSAVGIISSVGEIICNIIGYIAENPNIFRSIELIHKINSPMIIIHGKKDNTISYTHAISLLKKTNSLVQFVLIPEATHSNIEKNHYLIIKNNITNFL